MSVVLYIGGSKDGEKGVMPYGFSKSMKETASGPEIYVERVLAVSDRQVRIMALKFSTTWAPSPVRGAPSTSKITSSACMPARSAAVLGITRPTLTPTVPAGRRGLSSALAL